MAKFQVTLHRNTGATAEQAPFLGTYVNKGSIAWAEVLKDTSIRCGMPVDEVEAMLNGAFDEIIKLQLIQPTFVNLGFAVIRPVITGTFDASDAAFDPAKNKYELAMYFDKDIKNALVNVRPEIVNEEGATKVKLGNVFSKEQPRPYGVLRLGEVARGTGEHLVFTDDGAALKLEDVKTGAMIDIPLSGVTSEKSNVFEFTVPQNMLPGDYKVWVMSRGGDAEGAVQSVSYRVKVIEGETPAPNRIDSIKSEGYDGNFELHKSKKTTVTGAGIAVGPFDKVYLNLTTGTGAEEENDVTDLIDGTSSDTVMTASDGFWPVDSEYTDAQWAANDSVVKFRIEKTTQAGESITIEKRVYLFAQA